MMKLNAIQFAAGLSVDLNVEINELHDLIDECSRDESKIDEAVRTYRHLHSFLQGVEYMLDYFEDDEEREQLKQLHTEQWSRDLHGLWQPIMKLKWSRDLNERVSIMTCYHANAPETYEVTVGGYETKVFDHSEDVKNYLKSLKK